MAAAKHVERHRREPFKRLPILGGGVSGERQRAADEPAVAEYRIAAEQQRLLLHQKADASGRMPRRVNDADAARNRHNIALVDQALDRRAAQERQRRIDGVERAHAVEAAPAAPMPPSVMPMRGDLRAADAAYAGRAAGVVGVAVRHQDAANLARTPADALNVSENRLCAPRHAGVYQRKFGVFN